MSSLDKTSFEVSQDLMFEACSLVYRRWSSEADQLKLVRSEKPDASEPDWEQTHQIRLSNHTRSEALWRRRKDEAALIFAAIMGS